MKKQLLFLCIAAALIGCSKDNNEPSGGNGNHGGESNDDLISYTGVFNELTMYYGNNEPVLNHSKDYDEWMSKYGKNWETNSYSSGQFTTIQSSCSYDFMNYTFSEVDKIAYEFANFSLGTGDIEAGENYISNTCGSSITCFLNSNSYPIKSLGITYNANIYETHPDLESEWVALFNFTFENVKNISNYELPEDIKNWAKEHEEYLTNSEMEDDGSISYDWTIDFSNYDFEYVKKEIIPFLAMAKTSRYETTSVWILHRNDWISRLFVGVNY